MYLFKAAGQTYASVVRHERHAFPGTPREITEDEFVLLSKNREDCSMLEKQVQYVAKFAGIRRAQRGELERYWPGSQQEHEWHWMADLYARRALDHPFNLDDVPGLDAAQYRPVQGFARLRDRDAYALLDYLARTNEAVVLSFLNLPGRSEE
jgi:hypothetical protein